MTSMFSKFSVINFLKLSNNNSFAKNVIKHSSSSIGKGPDFPTPQTTKTTNKVTESNPLIFPPSLYDKRTFKIDQHGLPLLKPKDCSRRVEFATKMLKRMDEDKKFLPSLIFSDEGNFRLFKLPGAQKKDKHNKRFSESRQLPIIVWCGMTSRDIIGPFFFNSYVTENTYLRMIKTFFVPKLTLDLGYPLETTYFQQDGSPPHRSKKVLKYLKQKFGSRLISYGCSDFWPSKSQDLTPLDYFLWPHLKAKIDINYRPTNTDDMRECITLELENIDQDVLESVVFDFRNRLEYCIQNRGNRFEYQKTYT